MPGPVWDDDDPNDAKTIADNATALLAAIAAVAPQRAAPTVAGALQWHAALYASCSIPQPGYVAHFRGDPSVAELVGYEVGVGPIQPDGQPERMGVWSVDVAADVQNLLGKITAAVTKLDAALAYGNRPTTADELSAVVGLAAEIHGEWVRIHPFPNGNGRTARIWVAWLCVRYDLPVFVTLKPRPGDAAYARAARASMGRPPTFAGDHDPAALVFAHLLALSLLP